MRTNTCGPPGPALENCSTMKPNQTYRERLESSGQLAAFERARLAQDVVGMKRSLAAAKFASLEIESIVWAKGDIGAAPAADDHRKRFWDAVIGRIATGLVSGVILGGVFVYASVGLDSNARSGWSKTDVLMSDYRTPKEAYYQPFLWGFALGTIGGLLAGTLVHDPTSTKRSKTARSG